MDLTLWLGLAKAFHLILCLSLVLLNSVAESTLVQISSNHFQQSCNDSLFLAEMESKFSFKLCVHKLGMAGKDHYVMPYLFLSLIFQ